MNSKRYFSERQGRGPRSQPLPFEAFRRLVVSVFDRLREQDYFQEAFGFWCVDNEGFDGTVGSDCDAYFLRLIGREGVWPYWTEDPSGTKTFEVWDTDTLFDVIEVLHDLVSKPVDGRYHDYNNCGWHYETFDRSSGQAEYRTEINQVLSLNDPPYELDGLGHVVEKTPNEFRQLLDAPTPPGTEHDLVMSKMDAAIERFRARGASLDDRRHAVRDLADVLEAIRGDIKDAMLPADEKALFNVANGFAIRHNNRQQRGDYDRVTWLRWTFYVYLATIHAVLRVRGDNASL